MFEDNGWEVPTTYDELLDLGKTIKDAGMTPVAMDGGDGWPMAVYLSDLFYKIAGSDYSSIVSNAVSTGDFTDPSLVQATELLKKQQHRTCSSTDSLQCITWEAGILPWH